MRSQITFMFHRSLKCVLRLGLAAGLIIPASLLEAGPADHQHSVPAKLIQIVRDSTRQYSDVNAAIGAGYGQFLGCVSSPDHGAMGIHYINGKLVEDGILDAKQPEALIYEPSANGQLRLVGVRVHR